MARFTKGMKNQDDMARMSSSSRGSPSAPPRTRAAEAPPARRESKSCGIHDDADVPPLRR
jgi:hypothetical protein